MSSSTSERLQARLAQAALGLPRSVAARLAGKAIVVDGSALDPHLALAARAMRVAGRPGFHELGIEAAREEYRLLCAITDLDAPDLPSVTDRSLPGPAGDIPVRVYRGGLAPLRAPLVVYYHGGGFTIGDLQTHDVACRRLALGVGGVVMAVDYRLAPEHPFPAAVDDSLAAFRWAVGHAAELGADPSRVAVAGDSAGGTLAAVVCQQARDDDVPPAFGVLLYPMTDRVERTRSRSVFATGFLLEEPTIRWFDDSYTANADLTDPRISVLRADDLRGIPPQLVFTAGFDPLRDEGEAYVSLLRRAGVAVTHRRHASLAHGWVTMSRVAACRAAFEDAVVAMRRAFSRRP